MTLLEVGRCALEPSSNAGRAEGMCIDHHIRTASLKLCERNFQQVYMRSCAGGIIYICWRATSLYGLSVRNEPVSITTHDTSEFTPQSTYLCNSDPVLPYLSSCLQCPGYLQSIERVNFVRLKRSARQEARVNGAGSLANGVEARRRLSGECRSRARSDRSNAPGVYCTCLDPQPGLRLGLNFRIP